MVEAMTHLASPVAMVGVAIAVSVCVGIAVWVAVRNSRRG